MAISFHTILFNCSFHVPNTTEWNWWVQCLLTFKASTMQILRVNAQSYYHGGEHLGLSPTRLQPHDWARSQRWLCSWNWSILFMYSILWINLCIYSWTWSTLLINFRRQISCRQYLWLTLYLVWINMSITKGNERREFLVCSLTHYHLIWNPNLVLMFITNTNQPVKTQLKIHFLYLGYFHHVNW